MIRGRERLMMNAFCHGDLGWKPVTIPQVVSVVMLMCDDWVQCGDESG